MICVKLVRRYNAKILWLSEFDCQRWWKVRRGIGLFLDAHCRCIKSPVH